METTYIIGFLSAIIVVTELLVRKTVLKHFGTALLVILFTALFANIGLLPTGSTEANPVPAYDYIFSTIAPLAIFWLLLPVNLKNIFKAGKEMLVMFFIGSFATAVSSKPQASEVGRERMASIRPACASSFRRISAGVPRATTPEPPCSRMAIPAASAKARCSS